MAWTWCESFYPYTLSRYNGKTSMEIINSSSLTWGNLVRGNSPLDQAANTLHDQTWDITSRFKLVFDYVERGNATLKIYLDNVELVTSFSRYLEPGYAVYVGFGYDDSLQEGNINFFIRYGSQAPYCPGFGSVYLSQAQRRQLYPYIKEAMDIQPPDWHAVNSVSGELGTFEFSKIAQNHINGGSAVTTTDPNYLERVMDQTNLYNISQGTSYETGRIVIYSGSHPPYQPGNYMEIFRVNDANYWCKFYNAGVMFYEAAVSLPTGSQGYLSFLIDRNNHKALFSPISISQNPVSITYNQLIMSQTQMMGLYAWLLESDDSVIPSVNDEETPEGVNPWTPDDIDPLTAPTISAIDTGFTSMFQVTKTELQNLSDFLWSANFVDNVKKFFNDPREIIVGISIMPVAPSVGSDMNIQAGGIDTGIQGKPLTSQYVLMEDIGEVYIQKAKGNFLDYPPYTRIVAHLPFVGEHSLDVNDIMGKTLKLSYLFDFLSGSVVASIKVDGSTNYVFGGCCGMQVPTSSEDFGRLYSSLLSAGATLGTALATVATGGMTAPLAIGAGAAMANNGMNMSPEVQHTSGSGSINGMLGNQSAYITIEIPNEKLADKQNTFIGQMCMINKKIKQCTGYIKCYKAHLDGLTATQSERDEIESYLMNGFRRETGSTLPSVTPVTSGNTVIMFLKCSSENDVLGKTFDTVNYSKIEGKLVYNQSMLSPKFVITGDVTEYNYAYIPMFNRYYYITDIECNNGTVETVSFKVDALNSFKSQIDEFDVILERQENKVAPLLNDSQYWTTQNKEVIPKYFEGSSGKVKFSRANNVFILTIAGSNARTP